MFDPKLARRKQKEDTAISSTTRGSHFRYNRTDAIAITDWHQSQVYRSRSLVLRIKLSLWKDYNYNYSKPVSSSFAGCSYLHLLQSSHSRQKHIHHHNLKDATHSAKDSYKASLCSPFVSSLPWSTQEMVYWSSSTLQHDPRKRRSHRSIHIHYDHFSKKARNSVMEKMAATKGQQPGHWLLEPPYNTSYIAASTTSWIKLPSFVILWFITGDTYRGLVECWPDEQTWMWWNHGSNQAIGTSRLNLTPASRLCLQLSVVSGSHRWRWGYIVGGDWCTDAVVTMPNSEGSTMRHWYR